jgi:BirA family transcriptional regulator, biotin operon repressor / biotin---[acetyl-CoA-carboxylase] ligase
LAPQSSLSLRRVADSGRYDGCEAAALARLIGVPHILVLDSTGSTMDEAHRLAGSGAPAGTVVLSNLQTAGRGRSGRRWESESGQGIWMTVIERPNDPRALDVLSIRLGLRAARALDRYAPARVRLKWPNDLFVDDAKLAGILVEARWRAGRIDWVAIGIGVNVRPPNGLDGAASLRVGTSRLDVLAELVPAVRAAAQGPGSLSPAELEEFSSRDVAVGRPCVDPVPGHVRGISPAGELLVETSGGVRAFRDGSLTFAGATA